MTIVRIESAAPSTPPALRIHPADNVAVATRRLNAGAEVNIDGCRLVLRDPIPLGHKFSLSVIPHHDRVIRYGETIGSASVTIPEGCHVHVHNVTPETSKEPRPSHAQPAPSPKSPSPGPQFMGYPRENGQAGTRNYIVAVSASNCAAHVTQLVEEAFRHAALPKGIDGIVGLTHSEGCGHSVGPDTEQLERTLSGIIHHPNVIAAVVIGLGCEINQIDRFLNHRPNSRVPVSGLQIQDVGGTNKSVAAAVSEINRLVDQFAGLTREPVPASKIVLGLNCGGSDAFSGITANPCLGVCSSLLVQTGGAAVLAETPEIIGAEHLLLQRAANPGVADKLLSVISWYREYLDRFGARFDDNPSPGNKAGGITTIAEKSLGAVAKGGILPLADVVQYAQEVTSPGLVFMNTPGYDPVSLTGIAAGGANLIAFTTGRGSAIGFPTVPVVKIATNSAMFERMRSNMDFNVGSILDGAETLDGAGNSLLQLLLDVASGTKTCSEKLGHREFVPWRIGPVL